MAEEEQEDKEQEDKEQEEKPKKGLSRVILTVVGALLCGAGVVFGVPKAEEEPVDVHVEPAKPIRVKLEKNPMDFTFNPKSSAGNAFGQIRFVVEYEVMPDDYEESLAFARDYWLNATSSINELLRMRTFEEFNSGEGISQLKRDLVDELTYQLFPGPNGGRIAEVVNIHWTKFMVQ